MEICVLGEERVIFGGEQEKVNDVCGQKVMENASFLVMHLFAVSVVMQVNGSAAF